MVNPGWLAGTADRERVVDVLRAGFLEGRLTQEEFDERVARAYASRTYGQLGELTADLPTGPLGSFPPAVAYGPPAQAGTSGRTGAFRSGASLVLTALVIFTLAALITAIITAHAQHTVNTVILPGSPVHLLPFKQVIKP
jgi:Domain of unknown function (DUF1707)